MVVTGGHAALVVTHGTNAAGACHREHSGSFDDVVTGEITHAVRACVPPAGSHGPRLPALTVATPLGRVTHGLHGSTGLGPGVEDGSAVAALDALGRIHR